jgi:uncharacterized membrane protein YhaH (DUF805 family)
MQLIDAYTKAWTNALNYEGRSTRADFWWFVLANLIVSILVALVISRLQGLYTLASVVVGLPLAVRRLRDAGKTWPWLFLALIPIVGPIWLIVLYCQPTIPG